MKDNKKILVLPGDGIGPEVCKEATTVLKLVNEMHSLNLSFSEALVGGSAYEVTGEPLPQDTLKAAHESDAILLGAVGGPKWDELDYQYRPERALLGLRSELDLFANFRPAILSKYLTSSSSLKANKVENLDLLIIRELTGGIYFGEKGRRDGGETAFDNCVYTRAEVQRIAIKGFELAMTRGKKLCCVDKANVLETSRLWRETVQAMEKDYPEVEVSYEFVDAVAMRLVQWPNSYDVLITENLFGDILTDEASVISGSMGLMPSASVGTENALFEPIHGSYPQATDLNIANPMATILSAAMLFEHFGLQAEGKAIRDVVNSALEKGMVTEDLADGGKAYGTKEVGDWLAENI